VPLGRLPLALLAVALLAAAPAPAGAAVTIGSDLEAEAADNLPGYCDLLCTGLNLDLPATSLAPGGLRAPGDGVLVRWRVKSGSAGNAVALRILRPAAGTSSAGVGRSAGATTTTGIAEAGTRLPIRAGDGIGLDINASAIVWATTPLASGIAWSSGLPEGATAPGVARQDRELLVQAVLEADADRDGFGDETQDGCPAEPSRQAPPCTPPQSGTQPGPGTQPGTQPRTQPPRRIGPERARGRQGGDTTAPRLTRLAVRPSTLRLGARARIAFRVSEQAQVTLRFARLTRGRIQRGRCVPLARRPRTGRRCTAAVSAGSVTLRAQGAASLAFDGRVVGRRLAPGRYRVTVTAVDAAENASRPLRRTIRLRPARSR